jgi:CHAT domain-containing protein
MSEGEQKMAEGSRAYGHGDLAGAASSWREAERHFAAAGGDAGRLGRARAMRNLAAAEQGLGFYKEAEQSAYAAANLAKGVASADSALLTSIYSMIVGLHTYQQEFKKAEDALTEAMAIAGRAKDARAEAGLLNNAGNLHTAHVAALRSRKKYSADEEEADKKKADESQAAALEAYERAAKLAAESGDSSLEARALANAAVSAVRDGKVAEAKSFNTRALEKAGGLPDSSEKANLLTTAGQTDREIAARDDAAKGELLPRAAGSLQQAARVARAAGDLRAESYADGYLAALRDAEGRDAEAVENNRRAVFAAQRSGSKDSEYRWQYQAGRILRRRPDGRDEAIRAYTRAVAALESIKSDKAYGFGNGDNRFSFRSEIGPVYFGLADLLLRRAADPARSAEQQQRDVRAARDTVEKLKTGELQDYLKDPCYNQLAPREVSEISPNTAVLYVIPLEDRIELLVDLPPKGGPRRAGASASGSSLVRAEPVKVTSKQLDEAVSAFREKLQDQIDFGFTDEGGKLYDWIIRPIEPVLDAARVDTVVFVPDGQLRTIPIAAFYDAQKEQFLIEKYAVATTPGLTLMEPQPVMRKNVQLLMNGISEFQEVDTPAGKQRFEALPNVPKELAEIQGVFGGRGKKLLNDQFKLKSVREEMRARPYGIVHFASHGEFRSEKERTFLLAFHQTVTLDQLEDLIKPQVVREIGAPVELLTLSACQTAAGDDRAALGLAGVAIKSGARAALASLWCVNDASAAELIAEFYRQLADPTVSKAKALRNAQLKLLGEPNRSHPIHWAPFLIIGNWL